MSARIRKLEPAFNFPDGDISIPLHQGHVQFRVGEDVFDSEGEVRLDLDHQVGIHLYGHFNAASFPDSDEIFGRKEDIIPSFSYIDRQIEGSARTYTIRGTGHVIKWVPKSEYVMGVGDESTQMTRVVFHLFNFIEMTGTKSYVEQRDTLFESIHYTHLNSGEWKITIKSLFSTQENFTHLKKEGGYRLTHIGEIRKVDRTLFAGKYRKEQIKFTGKDAEECIDALGFFLSFAKGCWCKPICPVGFDENENRVWELWSSPTYPWQDPESWFEPDTTSQLHLLFPGFMERWEDDDWREALREVIYWYLNANHPLLGNDAGIILTQTAIERLSFQYSVNEKKLLTPKGFRTLTPSDKFRLLFSSLEIGLDFHSVTPKLLVSDLSAQMSWLDAPHALTEIRNSLVHPERTYREQFRIAYPEAWNLGLGYLEMCILAICDYSGLYWNRITQNLFSAVVQDTDEF